MLAGLGNVGAGGAPPSILARSDGPSGDGQSAEDGIPIDGYGPGPGPQDDGYGYGPEGGRVGGRRYGGGGHDNRRVTGANAVGSGRNYSSRCGAKRGGRF